MDRFDFTYATRFSTYAVPLIMGELHRFFRDDGLIRVSRSLKEQGRRILQARDRLEQELGQAPTLQELSEELQLPASDISAVLAAYPTLESLSPSGEDDGICPLERIPAPGPGEDERLDRLCLRNSLRSLSEEDQRLIVLRYYRNQTQSETGRCLGLSQVQVSRREKRILRWLRMQMAEDSGVFR